MQVLSGALVGLSIQSALWPCGGKALTLIALHFSALELCAVCSLCRTFLLVYLHVFHGVNYINDFSHAVCLEGCLLANFILYLKIFTTF